jgi:hypothetical protein
MLTWEPYTLGRDPDRTSLHCDGMEVARLIDRLDDTWFVILERQRDWSQHVHRDCSSLEAGKAGTMLWAQRHAERLHAEVAARRKMLWETQRWRGPG